MPQALGAVFEYFAAGAGEALSAGAGAGAAGTGAATAAGYVAAGVGAAASIYGGTQAARGINIPPSPILRQASVDEAVQQSGEQQRRRQEVAGGIQSTVGTAGGQAGSILNPTTMAQSTLLGK